MGNTYRVIGSNLEWSNSRTAAANPSHEYKNVARLGTKDGCLFLWREEERPGEPSIVINAPNWVICEKK